LKRNDTLGILTTKTRLWCIERQDMFYCSVDAPKELKKYATWQLHPYAHPILPNRRRSILVCGVVCWM